MAATFNWYEDTGSATGSPAKGTTRTADPTNVNWKSSGTYATAYTAAPIVAGANSFEKVQFGKFASGTFNNILAGLYAHTATAFGTGLTLKGQAAVTEDADRWLYTTPSATTNATLTTDMTAAVAIATGVAVFFGSTGPEATGKAATVDGSADRYTTYLTTQLQTAGSAAAGDTATVTMTLEYQEN